MPDRGDDELPNSPQLVSELDTNDFAEVVKTVVLTTSASVVLLARIVGVHSRSHGCRLCCGKRVRALPCKRWQKFEI